MNVADENTRSLWMETAVARAPSLERSDDADVVVIGAGIAGLSCAYELAARDRSVIVLDRGDIGSGMTARTTAHLASALDDDYAKLLKTRGLDCARQLETIAQTGLAYDPEPYHAERYEARPVFLSAGTRQRPVDADCQSRTGC